MAEADDIMVQQLAERERRRREGLPPAPKPKPICPFCFQYGNHRTSEQCAYALSRA